MNQSRFKFLGIHDPPEPVVPAAPPVTPQPAPQMVPAAVVIDLAEALARRQEAQQRLSQIQNPPTPPAPVAPILPPAPPAPAVNPEMQQLRDLVTQQNTSINNLTQMVVQERLNTYRANAIANARAGGRELVEALVFGSTPQEIDASVAVAVAEYAVLEANWQKKNPPPEPQTPQGTVTSTQVTPVPQDQIQPIQQQQPTLSLPGFISAAGVPDQQAQQISPEMLAHLTSPESIRNGTYAANRHLIHSGLQNSAGRPTQHWGFNNAPSLVPPMQPQAGTGLSVPNIMQRVSAGPPPHQGSQGAPPARGGPQQFSAPGRAPVPSQFQHEVAPGQYQPNGAPTTNDAVAARQAAVGSVASGGQMPAFRGQRV